MKIREVTRFSLKVYNAILRLLPQLSPDCKLLAKKHFRDILKSDSSHLFIAELDDNEIAGMFTVATYNIPTGIKVWIEDVVVDEKHRGKGYGKELILAAIRFAETLGAESVELTSRPSRVAANKLYQQVGFVQWETNKYKYKLESTPKKPFIPLSR
jgi:ribosomal protein S18 acetylase RimI-like enzyme